MEGIQQRTVKVKGINMHYAEKGEGPVILFLHGFPELWYSWHHQIDYFASKRFRAVAPDLHGFGGTDALTEGENCTYNDIVEHLIGLLDQVAPEQKQVFVVGHDWGAHIAWYLCLIRPDRVKALVNLGVPFTPPTSKPLELLKEFFDRDDHYISRFQEPEKMEGEFAKIGTEKVIKRFMANSDPRPIFLSPGGEGFQEPITMPPWLSEKVVEYYTGTYEKTGFRGAINNYIILNGKQENISETGSGSQIEVPVKFIIGSLDPLYNVAKVKDYIENGGMKKHVPSMEEPATILSCVGHYINQEVPDKVNKHIYDFFWPKLDSKDPDLGEFSVETVELNGIKMRYAEEGEGPVILFLHGFPEFWYSWRHQIKYFGSKGFRAVAPDLRGFGGTDAPSKGETDICMYFNIVGDLIQLLEKVAPSEEQVFVVGHDWGAHIAWYLCLLRPDRVKALVNLSVPFTPPDLAVKPLGLLKNIFNSNYHYISRFQEPAKMECEFAKIGIEEVIKRFMANSDPRAIILPPGGEGFRGTITVPPWLSKKVVEYYTRVYEKTGFRGAINNFINLNWKQEILARTYSRSQIKVPVKFIIGELDPILYDVPEIKDYIENGGMKKHVPTMEEPATILDRVGHYVNQEVPHEINEHIYDYFSRMVPGIQIKTAEVNGITMRYAEKGKGPVILFLHGFPEVWYSWRHQINYFASNGFRAVAPDLRGFGDTTVSYDEEEGDESFYTYSNITKDLTGLLDVVAPEQEKVFIVGHDLGAMIAWHLCLVHPERIQACVNLSVAFDAVWRPLADLQNTYGSTYYLCRFQGPKAIDDQFVYEIGVEKVLKKFFQKSALPVRVGEGEGFEELPLPPWLSEKDFKDHYVGKYMKTQFIGGISYYRNMDRNRKNLLEEGFERKIKVPVKFIVGTMDPMYSIPQTERYIEREMEKEVPLLEKVIMEKVGHFINQEEPDKINSHIYDFFQKHLLIN